MSESIHGCDGTCDGVFKCRHCERMVGFCLGADDDIEQALGPICDMCAFKIDLCLTEAQNRFLASAWRCTHMFETQGRPGVFPRGAQHRTAAKLCALGLMRFYAWGRDIDSEVDDDVQLFEPTDIGVYVAIKRRLIEPREEAAAMMTWGLRSLSTTETHNSNGEGEKPCSAQRTESD